MNIVFFGSSHFGLPSLRALLDAGHKICCVVTQPDKKRGRGLSLGITPIKEVARDFNLKIYQPENINTYEAIKLLKTFNPDLFIVIAYGQILSREVLDIPEIFAINVHASILPEYRGAAPVNWALIKDEKTTGVTVIKMTKEMDAGPIILQKTMDIQQGDTAITLEDKLSDLASKLLLDSVQSIQENKYELIPQDESKVSFAPKLKKEDGRIDWNKQACDIYNLIRGCISWPDAFTYYKGKLLKIYKAKVGPFASWPVGQPPPNGGVPPKAALAGGIIKVDKEGVVVATGKDSLIIEELQIEGKRRMNVEEFIAGHKISKGEILGIPKKI